LTQISFSPDGAVIAASRWFATDDGVGLNEVRLWDAATGNPLGAYDRCHGFSFAPLSGELLVLSQKRCVAYDLASGARRREYAVLAGAVRATHIPGGDWICGIVPTAAGFVLRKCDAVTGELLGESPPLDEPFYSITTPRLAARLATGHPRGQLLIWDLSTIRPAARLNTGGNGRAFPFFSPAGDLLGGADQSNSDIVIWDISSGRELARYTFQQGSVHTYFAKSADRLIRPEEDPIRFAFSPDGTSFLGGPFGGIVRLVQDGRDIARFGK
jgi:WD40 repeat protein